MIAADERHWWYRGRRRLLRTILDDLRLPRPAMVLDAGCGSGRTLDDLARYGVACGVDVSPEAIRVARQRGHRAVLASIDALPFGNGSFDLVTCLDVLEHTPDDRRCLEELRRVTAPGGHLALTVPAYPRLWSAHDVANEHFRRYTGAAVREAAGDTGWLVRHATHFNSALLPAAATVRALRRGRAGGRSELELTPRALDGVLELPLRAEAAVIGRGLRLPVGLSLLVLLVNPRRAALQAGAARPAPRPVAAVRDPQQVAG